MKENFNQQYEQNLNQYEKTQLAEKIFFLTIELQSQQELQRFNQGDKSSQEKEFKLYSLFEKSQNQVKELKQNLKNFKDEIYQKNQTIFEKNQRQKELENSVQSATQRLENYQKKLSNDNKESAVICIMDQEINRLRDTLTKNDLKSKLENQKYINKIQTLQNENEIIKNDYRNLSIKYQELRLEYEQLLYNYTKKLSIQQTNNTKLIQQHQTNQEQYKNKFSTQTFSKGSNQKNIKNFQDTLNTQNMSQQISQLINENFNLRVQLQQNQTEKNFNKKKGSLHTLNQTPKSNKTESHDDLSIGQQNINQIATQLNFNKQLFKTNENIEKIDLQEYFKQKKDLYKTLNNQDIELNQKKIYNIKRLNEILDQQINKNSAIQGEDKKLLKLLQEDLKNVNFEQNLDLQLISQNKQKILDNIQSQNQFLKSLNDLTKNQIDFLKNKMLQLKQKKQEFSNVKDRSDSSIIRKPQDEEIISQKDLILRLQDDYEIHYNKFIDLDKTKDQQIQNSQIEEFQLSKIFRSLDSNILNDNEYLDLIYKNFIKQKQQNDLTYKLFQAWIQNENTLKDIQIQIDKQQLLLSQEESELLENNQKHLFQVSESNQQEVNNNQQKFSKSFDPQQFSTLDKSKFKLNQTIGNENNNQLASMKLSDYEQFENFSKYENSNNKNKKAQFEKQILNLEDSYFKNDMPQQKQQTQNYISSDVSNKYKYIQQQLDTIDEEINDDSNHKKSLQRQKSLSDQKIQPQIEATQFSQTKINVVQNDLDSNIIQSSRTNKTNPYKRYHTFQATQEQQIQIQEQLNNLPSKGSTKSDFSRIFSHIGKVGSKKTTDLKIVHDKESQKVLIDDQDFLQLQEDFQNLENTYKRFEEIIQEIRFIVSAQNLQLNDLPNLIKKINNENHKYKKDFVKSEYQIDDLQNQVEQLIQEKKEFEELNKQLNRKIQQLQRITMKSQSGFNKSNPFDNTNNFQSFNNLQDQENQHNTYDLKYTQQNIPEKQLTQENNFSQIENSKIKELQIDQLVEENDFLMLRLQEERQKKQNYNDTEQIQNLKSLLLKCEQQLQQFRMLNTNIQKKLDLQIQKTYKIDMEYKKKTVEYKQQISFLEQQQEVLKSNYQDIQKEQQIGLKSKKNQQNFELDLELEQEKNQRLQNKIKNLQKQLSLQSSKSTHNTDFDYYIELIDKLKSQNKVLQKKIYELEKFEDQCKYLQRQLNIYEKEQQQMQASPDRHASKSVSYKV